jgi:hypothetical protein
MPPPSALTQSRALEILVRFRAHGSNIRSSSRNLRDYLLQLGFEPDQVQAYVPGLRHLLKIQALAFAELDGARILAPVRFREERAYADLLAAAGPESENLEVILEELTQIHIQLMMGGPEDFGPELVERLMVITRKVIAAASKRA